MAVKKKAGPSKKTKKTGRPEIKLDYEMITRLSRRGCTREEIADILGVSKSRLDKDPLFRDYYKKGLATAKVSLRRAQMRSAVHKGNAIMQIWLGKNLLGQRDIPEGDPDKPRRTIRFVRRDA